MRLSELFAPVNEISHMQLSKAQSWKYLYHGPKWFGYELLPAEFNDHLVIQEATPRTREFVIIDPSQLSEPDPSTGSVWHEIKGIEGNIPPHAVVGGMQLSKAEYGPIGPSWMVDFLAFSPAYQGKGLALKLYKWIIDNHAATGIGAIRSGSSQTPGSRKLWANLSKMLLVVAYDPVRHKTSQVEIDDDGELEADFPLYPDPQAEQEAQKAAESDTKLLKQALRKKEITPEEYKQEEIKIFNQLKQELIDQENAVNAILYAVPSTAKKKR